MIDFMHQLTFLDLSEGFTMFNARYWFKKYGLIGLVLFMIIGIVLKFLDAVFEMESQSLWFILKQTLNKVIITNVLLWHLLLFVVLLLMIGIAMYISFNHLVRRRIYEKRLPPPNLYNGQRGNVRAMRAYSSARRGEMGIDTAKNIIEESVNNKELSPKEGIKLLNDLGYTLVLELDGTYSAKTKGEKL